MVTSIRQVLFVIGGHGQGRCKTRDQGRVIVEEL